jgi:protein-disulfide isomerase
LAEDVKFTLSKDHVYGGFIVVLVALLVISVMTSGFGIMNKPAANTSTCGASGSNGSVAGNNYAGLQQLSVSSGGMPAQGQTSAPVMWVEFSDFQCPYCERLYSQTDSLINSNYVVAGKVQMYFRYFPLGFHDKANIAAMAAACANEQGKFWAMHNKLFESQSAWSSLAAENAPATFEGYATALGLDGTKFTSCMSTNKYATDIAASETEGQSYGVQGTPGVFLIMPKAKTDFNTLKTIVASNGGGVQMYQDSDNIIVFVAGAYPYATFSSILDTVTY